MTHSPRLMRTWRMPLGIKVFGCLSLAACSSASDTPTEPGTSSETVTLTANKNRMTGLGDIALAAEVTGTYATYVKRVEFYERVIGADPTPRKLGEDSVAPYEFTRQILGVADDGTREFTAKAYNPGGDVATSNSLTVVVNLAADTTTFRATISASHTRITTPGRINFTVTSNKAINRIEVYSGTNKVAEVASPASPFTVGIAVTASDNGTQAYVVKAYDLAGHIVESAPMTVEVDIRWNFFHAVEEIHTHSGDGPFVATDAANAVYVAGGTESWGVFLVKYDADVNRLWVRTFGGADVEHPTSVGIDAFGRIFVVGKVLRADRSYDCFLALYDPAGSSLGIRFVDIAGIGFCVAASDQSGNIYVAGAASDSPQGAQFLIKYDRDGSMLWTQRFGGTVVPGGPDSYHNDILTSITVDPLGGVYVGGYTGQSFDGEPNRGPRDLFVVKFDADGKQLWASQYGKAGLFTFAQSLAPDPDGGVYFAGQVDPRVTYNTGSALLVRYGSDGTRRWARTLDAGGDLAAWGVAADQRGVYLVGHTNRGGPNQIIEPVQGRYDAFLAQVTRDGDLLAVRLLGTPASEFAQAVALGLNGDLYMAGSTVYDQPAAINTPFLARHHDAP